MYPGSVSNTRAPATRHLLGALSLTALLLSGCGGGGSSQPTKQPKDLDAQSKARLAQSYMNAGRTTEALQAIDEAIELEPERASLHHFQGQILVQAGMLEDAEQAFLTTLALDSNFSDARNFLGAVYSEQGRYQEAETEFLRTLQDPSYPTPQKVHLNMATLYVAQGRDEDAIRHLRQAVSLDTRYYRAHFELASALERIGNLQEAAREYEVAEPGYRASGDYHYRRGLTYFRLGETQKARHSLMLAIDVSPGSESAARADELLRMMD